jgi:ribonuclease D
MNAHQKIITTRQEVESVIQKLREGFEAHTDSQNPPMLALDTEFIRETTFFPIVALIQIATEADSWLVDPIALSKEDLQPLLDLFQDKKVLKILHAAQADQECLYTAYGVVATPSLDTAVAASLCGLGESIGLGKLLKEVLGVNVPKGHARTDWTARPLSSHLAQYAHQDVAHLIRTAKKLLQRLDKRDRRQWALELSAKFENTRNYEPNPEALAAKLAKGGRLDRRGFATLIELVRWREHRVRSLDVPRRRVAEDDILLDLAAVRPKDMEHLSAFRGLNKGEFKASGEAILEAINRAAKAQDSELPEVPRPPVPEANESRAIELMNCFVKILAEDLEISARYLISNEDLLWLLREKFNSVDDLVRQEILTDGAARMIGEDLLEIVRGNRVLAIKDGRVAINAK